MEVDGHNILVASEKVRRRASKWDVEAERTVEPEFRISDSLPINVDTSLNPTEADSAKPNLDMNIESFEMDQPGKVSDNNVIHSEVLLEVSQNPKQIDLEDDCKDGFKKLDWEHVSQEQTIVECVEDQSGKLSANNIVNSDVLCELPKHSKQIDLEGVSKDGFKKHDLEHVPQDQTLAEFVENQEKPLEEDYDLPPGIYESHQWIRSISPVDVRSRSDRKSRSRSKSRSRTPPYNSRSRSRSWSRTKSPSFARKQGSERWTGTDRTRRTTSPCRDFAAGICRHGEECRFLHVGNGSKPVDRHHDSGSMDGRGSRIENINHHRENFSRRPDGLCEDGRGHNEQHGRYGPTNPCFDFISGRCQRGASCRYIHHGTPSDAGWSARDASRASFHDRRSKGSSGTGASLSHRPERNHHLGKVPCRFFLENRCCRGESCSFSHQVKPASIPISSAESQPHDQTASFAQPHPLNGQMPQVMTPHPQNLQNQFPVFHQPQNSNFYNANIQNQPSHPLNYKLNPQSLDFKGQVQQNLLMQSQNKSTYNLHRNIPQIVPPVHISQGQPDFNADVQMQQNLASQQNIELNRQGQPDFNVGAQIQPNLASHPGHSHQDMKASQISNVQNHLARSNPQNFNLDEKNLQATTHNIQTPMQQHIAFHAADSSGRKPSQINSDEPIANKVVTSEQAAKIVDLSASLAQFFGTTALNPQSTAGIPPQPFLNSVTSLLPIGVGASQTNLVRPTPFVAKPHVTQIDVSSTMREMKSEASQVHKDQLIQLLNDEEEGRKNAETKKVKEAKDIRMFKCALIEFVKDILKPKWKEGQLSKEAHKTIVKKVVDKVSGSLQGPNIPQTQEKIDLYLSISKPKLSKLVQAYLEKYVKS